MLIELSHTLSEEMPRWPSNSKDKCAFAVTPEMSGSCTVSTVSHHMHNGTHVDAPRHFDPRGKTIDELSIEDFYYEKPFLLRLDKKKGEQITLADALGHEEEIKSCDLLIIHTGYSSIRQTDPARYADDFPYLSEELAVYIRKELPLCKAVAVDVCGVDSPVTGDENGNPAHHALLETSERFPERTIRIFEDVDTAKLLGAGKIKAVCAFPVRWEGMEAAPVSMVAIV